MAAESARITAADFLIPPALRAWPLAADGAGRVGGVRLELAAEGGRTRLGACYQQVPLRVLPPFAFAPGGPGLLYLLNPTAGLLDGDAHLVEVTAGPGTRALVVGQSATRIHPSVGGLSTQQWRVRVEEGACLAMLPGPAIPFRGCRFYQRMSADLAPGAGFLWADVWLAGRYARGDSSELFCFAALGQDLTVRRAGRLVFRDRFDWLGAWDRATAAWHFGGALASGSLFVTGAVDQAALPPPGPVPETGHGLARALFPLASGDTCIRWLGPPEAVTAAVVAATLQVGSLRTGNSAGPWLAPHDLAPCHWFSAPPPG